MPFKDNFVGRIFGRLTVLSYAGNKKWLCRCSCPLKTEKAIHRYSLMTGRTKSCGCINKETIRKGPVTHGMSGSKEYTVWVNMRERCYNKNNDHYYAYGERGISVCDRWLNSFENFIEDMKICPPDKFSIDRIDVTGNYEPDNCRWATKEEQANNKNNNHYLTLNSKTQSISNWSKETGIEPGTILARILRGWSVEDTLTKQVRKFKDKDEN